MALHKRIDPKIALDSLQRWLIKAGAEIAGIDERYKAVSFSLPGDINKGMGRATINDAGTVKIWHNGLKNGLDLPAPFVPDKIERESGEIICHTAKLADIEKTDFELARPAPNEPRRQAIEVSPDQLRAAAIENLSAQGWTFDSDIKNGITYANDGSGSSRACRLVISGKSATVWSHRDNLDLPAPWRPGEKTRDGMQSWYATARDLIGIDRPLPAPQPRQTQPQPQQRAEIDITRIAGQLLSEAAPAPADHHHLTKKGAQLNPAGALLIAGGHYAGAIIVPMIKPPSPDSIYAMELCGAQLLLQQKDAQIGGDKKFLAGSKTAGAFIPVPHEMIVANMRGGIVNLQAWANMIDRAQPLIICEGYASALALRDAGYKNVVCAFSAGNVPAVAKFMNDAGIASTTRGTIIATDRDIAIDSAGRLKSRAVPLAIEAAKQHNALIAIASDRHENGADARDILARDGIDGVRRYIEGAQTPERAQQRVNELLQRAQTVACER